MKKKRLQTTTTLEVVTDGMKALKSGRNKHFLQTTKAKSGRRATATWPSFRCVRL